MHNTSTMHLIYQNPEGQEFSQHWRDLVESGTLVDPETGEDMELIGWHSDEVQEAWHAGLDEGREQGRGSEHCQAEPQPAAWQFQDRDGRWRGFIDEKHRQNTIADGSWPVRALYTTPPSTPVEVEGLMQLAREWCLSWGEWAHDADPGCAKESAAEAALRAALTQALSQQPSAAVTQSDSGAVSNASAPVGVAGDTVGLHVLTGVFDKHGEGLRAGDRIIIRLEGEHTKPEYWNPEYVIEWAAPRFTLRHVGGGLDSDTARWYFGLGTNQGYKMLELLDRPAALDQQPEAPTTATDIKLLPLPDPDIGMPGQIAFIRSDKLLQEWCRTNVAHATALLRAEVERSQEIVRPKREEECMTLDHWLIGDLMEAEEGGHTEHTPAELCGLAAKALKSLIAQQPAVCPKCDGTGEADSGGIYPWGAPAMIPCECQQPEAMDVAMRKVAAIAHSGGLIDMSPHDALTAIRRLSLPYWGKEEKPEQVHAALIAQQLPSGRGNEDDS